MAASPTKQAAGDERGHDVGAGDATSWQIGPKFRHVETWASRPVQSLAQAMRHPSPSLAIGFTHRAIWRSYTSPRRGEAGSRLWREPGEGGPSHALEIASAKKVPGGFSVGASPLTRRPAPRDGDLSPPGRGIARRHRGMCAFDSPKTGRVGARSAAGWGILSYIVPIAHNRAAPPGARERATLPEDVRDKIPPQCELTDRAGEPMRCDCCNLLPAISGALRVFSLANP